MPFDARNLAALIASDVTTLWFYRTTDTRAAVLAPGYFGSVAGSLEHGHVILCQTADALSWLPVRANAAVGNGLVLDATALPLRLSTLAGSGFAFGQAVSALTRTVGLLPLGGGLTTGRPRSVIAAVGGAVTSVTFRLLDATSTQVGAAITEAASGGLAHVEFTAPAPGGGYRIRAEDPDEPLATALSPVFVVTEGYALLRETSTGSLLTESGDELLL